MPKILNTITIEGNIFFKAKIRGVRYIKLVPCYDVQYGIVMRMMLPTEHTETLDKAWIKLEYSSCNDLMRFNCPAFLKKYKGESFDLFEDDFTIPGELCKIRKGKGDFSKIKHLIKVPKKIQYKPFFTRDGRFHVSLAYVRNNFLKGIKDNPYVKVSLVDDAVINHKIVVSIFSGRYLEKGQLAFKMKRYEHELVTPPISVLFKVLGKRIANFKYHEPDWFNGQVIIHTKEETQSERCGQRTGRRVLSLRQRVVRAGRQRNGIGRAQKRH